MLNFKVFYVLFSILINIGYVDELMSILTALVDRRMELCAMMGQDGDVPPPLCSEYQRPDKKKAVESKFSRFAGK